MTASLAGIPLLVDPGTAWAQTWGVDPYQTSVLAPVDRANQLVALAAKGALLRLGPVEVAGVRALGVRAGPSRPDVVAVLLTDARWTWQFGHARIVANVRTETGDRRRVGDGPLAVKQLVPAEAYRAWSLDGGRPWTVRRLLEDVATRVGGRVQLGDALDAATLAALNDTPENVQIDDRLDVAVARVLAYAGGGVGVYVGTDGVPVFAATLDQSDRILFGAPLANGTRTSGPPLGPMIVGTPGWVLIDRRLERPARYRVLFDRRLELRLDYADDESEGDWATDGTAEVGGGAAQVPPPLDLVNVLPVPDETITIAGREVTQGVYVPVSSYVAAKAGTWLPAGIPDLTLEIMRASWLAPALGLYTDPLYDAGGVQARAIGAVWAHYRAGGGTFQIRRALRERLVDLEASLVSIVDPATGSRPISPVFADHANWLGWRSLAQEARGGPLTAALVRNYFADGTRDGGPIDALPITRLRRAPATVQVVSQDLGILRVSFALDATGEVVTTLGSALDPDTAPSTDPAARRLLLQWARIAPRHRLAVVVTAGLGAPADERGLFAVEVDGRAALRRAGAPDAPCEGPVCTLRVAASTIYAMLGWQDDRKEEVRQVLAGLLPPSALDDLVINENELNAVALAVAGAHASPLADRVDGALTTGIRPATPAGGAAVEYRVGRDGQTTTVASAAGRPAPPLEALLPDAVRRLVTRRLPP